MINSETVFEILTSYGINFFTGVPDSLLKHFCAYITDNTSKESHVIAANEGNAIGLATGHYLGSGKPALVYLQNSGLGNVINPLISLADKEVYSIPMLIMIGWRGEPGMKDEPQHMKQGRITKNLLKALEVDFFEVGPKTAGIKNVFKEAIESMNKNKSPTVVLVKKNLFEEYNSTNQVKDKFPLSRENAICTILENLDSESLIVSTTGMISREVFEYRSNNNEGHFRDFLTVGSMGHSSSISLGLALTCKSKKIVCLDGDGSLIMHLGATAIQGDMGSKNFLHIILNNAAHDSVGGQPTVAHKIKIAEIAKNCGYKNAIKVCNTNTLIENLEKFKKLQIGPNLIEVIVKKGARANLGRPTTSPIDNKKSFMSFIKN